MKTNFDVTPRSRGFRESVPSKLSSTAYTKRQIKKTQAKDLRENTGRPIKLDSYYDSLEKAEHWTN